MENKPGIDGTTFEVTFDKDAFTPEKLREEISELLYSRVNINRKSVISTNKAGIIIYLEAYDRPLTQEEKDRIPEGWYSIKDGEISPKW